jgi:hypothetical protein
MYKEIFRNKMLIVMIGLVVCCGTSQAESTDDKWNDCSDACWRKSGKMGTWKSCYQARDAASAKVRKECELIAPSTDDIEEQSKVITTCTLEKSKNLVFRIPECQSGPDDKAWLSCQSQCDQKRDEACQGEWCIGEGSSRPVIQEHGF